MRERLVEIIEPGMNRDIISRLYDLFMISCIVLSLIPLVFKTQVGILIILDKVTVSVFIIDYIARWITADLTHKNKSLWKSFLLYPLTPMAIIDLLSILPSITVLSRGFKVLRLFRAFKVLRIIRYSKSIKRIKYVFIKQKGPLIAVVIMAFLYVLMSSLILFNVEPEAFDSFFDAVYWSVAAVTTMGEGDIELTSTIARLVTMTSAIFGIAIIALPSGIITAGYINELNREKSNYK